MYRPRVIPTLLLQGNELVKTVQFGSPHYIGDPINAVHLFNSMKADELVFLDINATREKRTIPIELVKQVGEEANMPFSVGGGIKSLDTIREIISAGAERVIIGSYAVENPEFIREAAEAFGSSTIAVCIDYKKKWLGGCRVHHINGKQSSNWTPLEFALKMQEMGAGELLVQSIEHDGKMSGYDLDVLASISNSVTVPVVALGGAGSTNDLRNAWIKANVNGLAAGSLFVYQGTKKGVLINYPEKSEWYFPAD